MKDNNANNTIAFRRKSEDSTDKNIITDSKVVPFPKNKKIKKGTKSRKHKRFFGIYINLGKKLNSYDNYNKNYAKQNTKYITYIFYFVILVLLVALIVGKIFS